jgi:hypothetical protein
MEVVERYEVTLYWYLPVVLSVSLSLGRSFVRTDESTGTKENTDSYRGFVEHTMLA